MRMRPLNAYLSAVAVLVLCGCSREPQISLNDAANSVSAEVGKVQKLNTEGNRGPIFVFEENHASKAGQVQIATMLLRLHDKYHLKTIGLEGAIQAKKPIDAAWFSKIGSDSASREDVGVQMLSDGQISSAEFMTMLYPDVAVHGLELESEYNQNAGGSGELTYLLFIALQKMSDADSGKLKNLLDGSRQAEALDLLSRSDPWVKTQIESLRSPDIVPIEQEIARAHAIKERAESLGVPIPQAYKDGMDSTISFYETASQRSATMVDRVLHLPGVSKSQPVAMIIGAGHTSKIVEGLAENKAEFAVLRPAALDDGVGATLSNQDFELKEAGKWIGAGKGSLAEILNSKHKPPPVVSKPTAPTYASMNYAADRLAKAAASGLPLPDAVSKLGQLPGVLIDPSSVKAIPNSHDVIFSATIVDDRGNTKQVWARAGTLKTAAEAKTLEEKLLNANHELTATGGGGAGNGGHDGKSTAYDDPPGGHDGKTTKKGKGENSGKGHDGADHVKVDSVTTEEKTRAEYNRASIQTLVIFSEQRETVANHAPISRM